MKTIGLIGGMSWESSQNYYQLINQEIKKRRGGLHSAKLILYSVDFAEIEKLQHQGNWEATAKILSHAAQNLEKAGADFVLICTNTMHLVAPKVSESVQIPLLHIADATAENIVNEGINKIGLLGTAFTMEQDFYKGRLQQQYGLEVLIPAKADREIIHQIIYKELCLGKIVDASRDQYLRIINQLLADGAEGVILGCTEIAMLVKDKHTDARLFDTTKIHALKAVEVALAKIV